MKGVPVKPMVSKLKMTSTELTDLCVVCWGLGYERGESSELRVRGVEDHLRARYVAV